MQDENRELLVRGAGELGIELDRAMLDAFDLYLSLLDKWSKKINLTGLRDERERTIKLLVDSLAVVPLLNNGMRVMDLGSGAGFPGVPARIVLPGMELVAAESREKRASFLRQVIRELGLDGAGVFPGRAEQYPGEKFDAVLSKAVGSIDLLASLASGVLCPGGFLLAMKGLDPGPELRDSGTRLAETGFLPAELRPYSLLGGFCSGTLVILKKCN